MKISKQQIKWVRSLQLKKNRTEENCFVVEGEKLFSELLTFAKSQILSIFHLEDFVVNNSLSTISYQCTPKELSQISSLKTPNKVVAVVRLHEVNYYKTPTWKIALDGIQDPGNMGTILRLADWYGISEIICSEDTVDWTNSKVIQASMGAIYRVRIRYENLSETLKKEKLPIYGALLAGNNFKKEPFPKTGILLMGNEGKGIREENLSLIEHPITIPRLGAAESLNVSTATAILLAEIID